MDRQSNKAWSRAEHTIFSGTSQIAVSYLQIENETFSRIQMALTLYFQIILTWPGTEYLISIKLCSLKCSPYVLIILIFLSFLVFLFVTFANYIATIIYKKPKSEDILIICL